jgi:hypothetical protein
LILGYRRFLLCPLFPLPIHYQPTITGDLVGEENETKSPVMVGSGGKSNKINKRKKKKIIKIAFFYLIFFLFLFIFSSLPNSFSLLGF